MTEPTLTPATREDLRSALSFALRYDSRGKATRSYQNPAADAAAEHLIEVLDRSGFVVMRKPPLAAHRGRDPEHSQLKTP